MSTSEERRAENEAVFREANENIRETQRELGLELPAPFVCECEDERCRELVRLTAAEYERVRSNPAHFLLAPGHPSTTGRVLERNTSWWLAEKQGRAAAVTRETDPR